MNQPITLRALLSAATPSTQVTVIRPVRDMEFDAIAVDCAGSILTDRLMQGLMDSLVKEISISGGTLDIVINA